MRSWLTVLADAVKAEKSQAAVARKIGYSPATVSGVLKGTYGSNTDKVAQKVMEVYGNMDTQKKIPEGYIENAKGDLVLITKLTPLELQRNDLTMEILEQAKALAATMAQKKQAWLDTIAAHIQLAADDYKVKVEGKTGNVTLTSYDGSVRIERQYSRTLVVNERAAVAKELVERYITGRTATLNEDDKRFVRAAFRVDDKGNFSATALLSMARKVKSTAPEWQAALTAINDSVTTEYGEAYVRVYERDEYGNYQQIPMDMSSV